MTQDQAARILAAALDEINETFGDTFTTTLVLRPKNGKLDATIVIGNDRDAVDLNQRTFVRKIGFEGNADRNGIERDVAAAEAEWKR